MKPSVGASCRAILLLLLACGGGDAFALERDLSIAQYQHTSWTAKDGAPLGIWEIEQTLDGWIWLAGPNGLFRFDGIRFERVPVPEESGTDSPAISRLEAGPSGEIWIGHFYGGVSLYKNGRMRRYGVADGFDRVKITSIRALSDGTVWASSRNAIYRFDGSAWRRLDAGWKAMSSIDELRVDDQGMLWVFGSNGSVQYLQPGASHFESIAPLMQRLSSTQLIGGDIWEQDDERFKRVPTADGDSWLAQGRRTRHQASIVDRDSNLWSVFCPAGVCRARLPTEVRGDTFVRPPMEESFTFADGLSSDLGMMLLEDHNGSIWVVTRTGLDRFRRAALVSVPLPRTVSNLALAPREPASVTVAAYSPAANSMWAVDRSPTPLAAVQGSVVSAIHRDRQGRTWIASLGGLWREAEAHWERIPLDLPRPAPGEILSIDSDSRGLLLYVGNLGVMRYEHGALIPLQTRLPARQARCVAIDAQENVWIGFVDNQLSVLEPGKAEKTYDTRDGIDVGAATYVVAGRQTILVAGDQGVDVKLGDRFYRLRLSDPEAAYGVTGMLETPDGDLWLNGRKGAVHVAHGELAKLQQSVTGVVDHELFDVLDGYPSGATSIRPRPSLVRSSDGRLWFAGIGGLAWLDPHDTRPDAAHPHVVIDNLSSAGQRFDTFDPIDLPEHTSSVEIRFTAPGSLVPERTRYRHRLDGADTDWKDAYTRRDAVYTNLGPGRYLFHVRAVDERGTWRGDEASLAFTIKPAYYQTKAFAGLCAVACAALLWGLIAIAMRRSSARAHEKMQDRLQERERIARELHDTLLQGMQGLILRIQSIAERIPAVDPTRADMEQALLRADAALIEGRDRVANLRDRRIESQGLASDLDRVGHELARDYSADFRLTVAGPPRPLKPAVHDELLTIATEAMLNAFRHAGGNKVETHLRFGRFAFVMQVRDNGKGIAAEVARDGVPGHWGLSGMRERASAIGASIRIGVESEGGTRIEVRLAGRSAYAKPVHATAASIES